MQLGFYGASQPILQIVASRLAVRFALTLLTTLGLLIVTGPRAAAQVTIMNTNHVEIPTGQPESLLQTAREVVAKEFHIQDASDIEFPMVLVLTESAPSAKENAEWDAIIDEKAGSLTVYMKTWNETKFAALAIRLCLQKFTNSRRQLRLVNEVLSRAKKIGPISASELQKRASHRAGKPRDATSSIGFKP